MESRPIPAWMADLEVEYQNWQRIVNNWKGRPSEVVDGSWSLKDILGHLTNWQKVSVARLQAALTGKDPVYPAWFPGRDPETSEALDAINRQIYESALEQDWDQTVQEWELRFLELIRLAAVLPEEILTDDTRFEWLRGYPVMAVIDGTLEHHREHRESLFSQLEK